MITVIAQVFKGKLSIAALRNDTWEVAFPYIGLAAIVWMILVVKTAIRLNSQLLGEIEDSRRIVLVESSASGVKRPPLTQPITAVCVLVAPILLAASLTFRAAFPQQSSQATQEPSFKEGRPPSSELKRAPDSLDVKRDRRPKPPGQSWQEDVRRYLKNRTLVYISPMWDDQKGRWHFFQAQLGYEHPVNNLEVRFADVRLCSFLAKSIFSGLHINPQPGVPHSSRLFDITVSEPNDQWISFILNESKGSLIQELRLQISNSGHAAASRLTDTKTHEVLLACKDREIYGLEDVWKGIRGKLPLPECDPIALFREEAMLPQRLARDWK